MTIHFQREMKLLKQKLLTVGAMTEESVKRAVKAVTERDRMLAQQVIEHDEDIDNMEVEVEEDCLKILALHQPVAADLRLVVACLKINNDLERIGDLASNVAERAISLADQPVIDVPFDLHRMDMLVQRMVRDALDALVNLDDDLARQVCADDDAVDALNRQAYSNVRTQILEDPARLNVLVHYMGVSRHMERIADHATNIAEDVIYMIEGEIVRHRTDEFHNDPAV